MVRRGAAALVAVVWLTPAPKASGAEREESLRAAAAGACTFVRGVADAEADVLVGPELFGRFGGVNLVESTVDNGTTLGAEKQRLTLGVNYSLGKLYRASPSRSAATRSAGGRRPGRGSRGRSTPGPTTRRDPRSPPASRCCGKRSPR